MAGKDEYARFKWVLPAALATTVIFMGLGPFLFVHAYDFVIRVFMIGSLARLVYMTANCGLALFHSYKVPVRSSEECKADVTYAWVIPSYNEEESIICETLRQLQTHSRAQTHYTVFLAMEAHESNAVEKVERIISKFRNSFRHIGYTLHKLVEGEAKGKASNVSYCVESFKDIMPSDIELDKVFVTVMDCDSLAPKQYIDEINYRIYKDLELSKKTTFAPVQIFARNNTEVPLLVRSFDAFHSMAHWSSAVPGHRMGFPLSNYTISYNTIKSIGFWDKHGDAIAEDYHTTSKAFWTRNGEHDCEFIYTPFNQLNLESGDGYVSNLVHKFKQAVRHVQGYQEIAYCFQKFSQQKVKTIRSWMMLYFNLDVYLINGLLAPLLVGICMYQMHAPITINPARKSHFEFMRCGVEIICTICNILCVVLHHLFVRYSAKRYYNQKPAPMWKVLEYYSFLLFGMWVMMLPSILVSIVKGALKPFEYVTAPKKQRIQESITPQIRATSA